MLTLLMAELVHDEQTRQRQLTRDVIGCADLVLGKVYDELHRPEAGKEHQLRGSFSQTCFEVARVEIEWIQAAIRE
jgi:hypothetical protein